ncbi:MAG: DinB family protein [Thermoanaerobaculia bacterium]
MRMIDPMIMEFDRECATSLKLLERVPADKFDWAPHAKSMTLGKLANHVATLPGWIGSSLLGEGFDFGDGKAGTPPTPTTTAELVAAFQTSVTEAKKAMAQLDDEKAMGQWTLSGNGKAFFSMPRIALVRTILINHSIHHRGQLSVYLRLLDVPLPSIYGPTADENPFA